AKAGRSSYGGAAVGQEGFGVELLARMVLPLDMVLDVRAVEVDIPQIPRTVPFRLIVEVRRRGVAALAACGDGLRAHFFSKLDHGNEAVPARPVPLLCAGVGARSERRKRSPDGRGEA